MAFSPGDLVGGRYRLMELIGAGGYGQVFAAKDERTGKKVAVKSIVVDRDPNSDQAEDEVVVRHRFTREIKALSMLDHASVVRLLDVSTPDEPLMWVVTELLTGQSLQDRIDQSGALPERDVFSIAQSVLEALAEAHAIEVAHRDIKPANIFLCSSGRVVLIDFGLARGTAAASSATMVRTVGTQLAGTPYFVAPEQLRGTAVSMTADVYSLGITLRYALTGEMPFAGTTMTELLVAIMEGRAVPLNRKALGLKTRLPDVLEHMSQSSIELRPASAKAALDELRSSVPSGTITSPIVAPKLPADEATTVGEATVVGSAKKDSKRFAATVKTKGVKGASKSGSSVTGDDDDAADSTTVGKPLSLPTAALQTLRAVESSHATAARPTWEKPALYAAIAIALLVLGIAGWKLSAGTQSEGKKSAGTENAQPSQTSGPSSPSPTTALPSPSAVPTLLPPPADTPVIEVSPAKENAADPTDANGNKGKPKPAAVSVVKSAPGAIVLQMKQWADVRLDGKEMGRKQVMARFEVPPGAHTVELTNPAYPLKTLKIVVPSGGTAELSVDLKTPPK